ncbi:RRQRL motif-containing zinc-binding protein [Streptomyces sp. NPDC056817]|uniref:RRQRL motif-containing zinc-binding protein n=1 Tax=Streptomyces sp. NPDC056817 TaxID=3345950 RepID=UPI0036A09787
MPESRRANPRASSRHNPPSASAFPRESPSDAANPLVSEYDWQTAPEGLATRRQLRAARLRPGGHEPVAILRCRACATRSQRTCTCTCIRPAYLYRVDLAVPVRPMTLAREHVVLEHLEHAEAAWESNRAASTTPWLFAGLNPARPIQSQYMYLKLRRLGLGGLAGRSTARLALAADVLASILAALTGTSIDNATDWSNFVKRNWTGYIASRRNDSQKA